MNNKSNLVNFCAGVPQDSVIKPLSFLIYINDICDNLSIIARLFAVDTSLSHSGINQLMESQKDDDLNILNE